MNTKKKFSNILRKSNNLPELFYYYLKKSPYKKILYKKNNDKWIGKNYSEIAESVNKIILYLKKINFKRGDRVFLLSSNRIEWVEFDLAVMTLGGIIVPSYVTNNLIDNQFIINDCKPQFVILENSFVYKKNSSLLKKISKNRIILIDDYSNFISYKKITAIKSKKQKIPKIKKSEISSIIYTSGTGGKPKGVVLSHESIFHNLEGALEVIKDFGFRNHRFLSFLPLSHSYERMAGLYFPLLIAAEIFFCSSIDKVIYEIKETKPTIVSAVPRLYENIYKKIKSQINKSNLLISYFLKNIFFQLESFNKENNLLKNFINKLFIYLILKKKSKLILAVKLKHLFLVVLH